MTSTITPPICVTHGQKSKSSGNWSLLLFQCSLVLDDNINLYFQLIVIREAIKYKFQLPIMPCGRGRLHKFTGF